MAIFKPGLVHTPVTPFKADQSVDYDAYGKVLEFHLKNGADALAVPMPEGEDMSLTDGEQKELMKFVMQQVKGRKPVIAHVSDAGTALAVERAQLAQDLGVAALVTHPPYFWHTKPAMTIEHIVQIGKAVRLPVYAYNPIVESVGVHLTTEMTLQILEKLPNFAGVIDSNMDWVYMVEAVSLSRVTKPDFQLFPGTDFIASASVVGGKDGAFSPLSAVAPKLVRQLFDLCQKEEYVKAREPQEHIGAIAHAIKLAGFPGLKAAMRYMGRDCGVPRPPVKALDAAAYGKLAAALDAIPALKGEPRGW